jgi:hypothetical protein
MRLLSTFGLLASRSVERTRTTRARARARTLAVVACIALPGLSMAASNASLPAVAAAYGPDSLMDWAESTYPQFFPGPQSTLTQPPYVYRYYPSTQNYLGVAGDTIYILGPLSNGQLQAAGTLAGFHCRVQLETCPRQQLPRVAAGNSASAAIGSEGEVVVWGQSVLTRPQSAPSGTEAWVVGLPPAKSVVFSDEGAMALGLDGKVHAWGRASDLWLRRPLTQVPSAASKVPTLMPWPAGDIVQIAIQANVIAVALYADGSVWTMGGKLDGSPRADLVAEPRRAIDLPPVRALSTGPGLMVGLILANRTALSPFFSGESRVPYAKADQLKAVDCYTDCLGLTTTGEVLTLRGYVGSSGSDSLVVAGLNEIVQVAVGGFSPHIAYVALHRNGLVFAWGRQGFGAGMVNRDLPEPVPGLQSIVDVACAKVECIARGSDGTLWSFSIGDVSTQSLRFHPPRGFPPIRRITGVPLP